MHSLRGASTRESSRVQDQQRSECSQTRDLCCLASRSLPGKQSLSDALCLVSGTLVRSLPPSIEPLPTVVEQVEARPTYAYVANVKLPPCTVLYSGVSSINRLMAPPGREPVLPGLDRSRRPCPSLLGPLAGRVERATRFPQAQQNKLPTRVSRLPALNSTHYEGDKSF